MEFTLYMDESGDMVRSTDLKCILKKAKEPFPNKNDSFYRPGTPQSQYKASCFRRFGKTC